MTPVTPRHVPLPTLTASSMNRAFAAGPSAEPATPGEPASVVTAPSGATFRITLEIAPLEAELEFSLEPLASGGANLLAAELPVYSRDGRDIDAMLADTLRARGETIAVASDPTSKPTV